MAILNRDDPDRHEAGREGERQKSLLQPERKARSKAPSSTGTIIPQAWREERRLFSGEGPPERHPQCGEYDGGPHRGQDLSVLEEERSRRAQIGLKVLSIALNLFGRSKGFASTMIPRERM